jgi:transposase-like protein
MKKVPPSERLSKEIEEVLSGASGEQGNMIEELIERSVRMVMQRILEQEVTDYLGQEVIEELHPKIRSVFYQTDAEIARMHAAKIIGEKSCLKLVYATMVRASQKWRRVKMSAFDLALLRNIKKLYDWEENEDGFISKKAVA